MLGISTGWKTGGLPRSAPGAALIGNRVEQHVLSSPGRGGAPRSGCRVRPQVAHTLGSFNP